MKVEFNIDMKLVSVVIISVLVGIIGLLGYQLYVKPTGYATANLMMSGSAEGPNQGFSSYEEMMAAHHGGSAQQGASCGMDSGPSQAAIGELTDYGVTLDGSGYNKLLQANALQLSSEQMKNIVGLDIQIPCCGFQKIQASGNCECGHHVAMVGLAKLLTTKNYSREQIQQQLNVWKTVFYPDGAESGAGACG